MSGYELRREQRVHAPIEDVFPFFEDPRNLAEITPPWLRFEVVRATDERVREGTEIEYRIRWLGLRLPWVSRITRWDPPHGFADEMLRGPYRRWLHTHAFEGREGAVVVRDLVDYELPAGPLGRLAHRLLVRRQLDAIFDYRAKRVAERFPADVSGASPPPASGSVK